MGCPSTCPLHPLYFLHQIFCFLFLSSLFIFMDSLLFHESGIFYKTTFRFFLSFWEHFKTWGGKLDVLKVLSTKATKHRDGNRRRSDVVMVRRLRRHMAPLSVGPCPKTRGWGHPCESWVPQVQGSNLLCKRYL
jgi:hypothetical protein